MKKFFTTTFSLLFVFGMMNAQTIFSEDFEADLPADWTAENIWSHGNAATESSTYFTIPDHTNFVACNDDAVGQGTDGSGKLITPTIDLTTANAPILSFACFFPNLDYQGLDETTKVMVSTDDGATWTEILDYPGTGGDWGVAEVDISAYAGMEVKIAFDYADGNQWNYGTVIDDVTIFDPVANDVEVTRVTTTRFLEIGTDTDVEIEIINKGSDVLTAFDVSWTDGTNTYTDNVTGLNLAYNDTYVYTHSTSFTVTEAISYNFDVWTSNPNGVADLNDANDNGSSVSSGVSYIPFKKVVAEEATGTWCPWCPRGAIFMDLMEENYPGTFVGIAVHNQDPMMINEYDNGLTSFPGFTGFPSVVFQRDRVIDPSDLETHVISDVAVISPVAPSIEASLDVATKTLTIDGSAEFVTQLENIDYRLNIVLTEDHVTGSGSPYAQANAYAGGGAGPMGGYENLPNPVPAADMEYNHTARAILGGWAGFAGSVAANVVAGDVASDSWTYDFPDNWAPGNMHAVIMVLDNATGAVLNADSKVIDIVCPGSLDLTSNVTDASVPGATDGAITINPGVGIGPFSYEWTASNGVTGTGLSNLEGGLDYTITVWDNAGCSETVTVSVGLVSGLEDIQNLNHFSLTPNPTSDISILDLRLGKAADLNIQVVNAVGQVMIENNYSQTAGGQYELDLSNFSNGVYLVRLTVDNATHTERLILSK